ncbi:beta-1,6-N-acetylglucosaminyltransferase [Hymenobacter sp. HD11105]
MRIAHLILAHKNPAQVQRLLAALAHEEADCYLHLDQKSDQRAFAHLTQQPHVYFAPRRFQVDWGSYRLTRAIVECTRDILATGMPYDFINLISGQDYPLLPAAAIHRLLASHRGKSFMAFEPQEPGSAWWQHAIVRVERYHTTYFKFRGQYRLQAVLNAVLPKRRFPLPYTLYGKPDGGWWTMSRECAAYLVQFLDDHPQVRRFSQFTWGSDEFLLPTILLNSPLRDRIVNENYRYTDWSAGGASPKTLTEADFSRLADSPKLYARKFDLDQDAKILDRIDRELLPRRQPALNLA